MTAAHGVGTPKGLPLLRPGQSGLCGEPPELVVVVEAAALYMGTRMALSISFLITHKPQPI
jgi:hypothetical protein